MTSDTKRGDGERAVSIFVVYLKELPLTSWVETAKERRLVPGMHDAELALQIIIRRLDHPRDVFAMKEAVLVRDRLSVEDFKTLYAPFESRIPAVMLFGLLR